MGAASKPPLACVARRAHTQLLLRKLQPFAPIPQLDWTNWGLGSNHDNGENRRLAAMKNSLPKLPLLDLRKQVLADRTDSVVWARRPGQRDARWLPADARILAVGMAMFSVHLANGSREEASMRTQAIALAVLVCSGAVLAQNPLGDDSGPNANDGQCDDTRFENIGAGNSNIVFWEGGRYDGRDATDCRDLLLQGLINWRDGVDPRVDTVLATGEFGDDSGPNANDGQCDDARFENIGAGNSNIVFWEGGRYDGRDATDCADLLLQGLIAWRRDTAVAEVLAEPETPTVAEAQQQQPTTLPEGVTAESVCTDNPGTQACWMELDSLPDCYVWNPRPHVLEIDTWSGQCSDGFGTGTGVFYRVDQEGVTAELPYVNGEMHGTETVRTEDGHVEETPG